MAVKFIDVSYKKIFEKVNFEIEKGKIISLVGKSGSGKTTIFDMMFGLNLNFDGKITLGKKVIDKTKKQKQLKEVRKDIFYLRQDYYEQLFNINIFEDIKYYIEEFHQEELDEMFKLFGLNMSILKKHNSELSNGEIKKIVLIIMFLSNKKILLLDDVTSNLDFNGKKALVKQLKKIKREGKIIILSSSDSDFLLEIVDEIAFMCEKKVFVENNKYNFFEKKVILNNCNMEIPKILQFRDVVLKSKKIKLIYRDNINDLIKDIYRSAK